MSKRKPWYVTDPELYVEVRSEIEDAYPDLRFEERDGDVFVVGWYPLHKGSRVYDRYLVKVQVPEKSPKGLPTVWEVEGRIPRKPELHMESDGKACIALPDAFWYENPKGMSLMEFLDGPVRWFFANQSLIERGKKPLWEDNQWEHAGDGIVRYYQQHIGTDDPQSILQLLEFLTRDNLKGHWPCPCGSNAKLRNCHWSTLKDLHDRISKEVAERAKQILSKPKTVLSK